MEHAVATNKYLITGGDKNSLYFFNIMIEGSKNICKRINKEVIYISSYLPDILNHSVKSLAVSPNGQWLIISLSNNQMLKADISLNNLENIKFDYLHYNNHSASVS